MFVSRVALPMAALALLTLPGVAMAQGFRGGTQIKPGEECPPGTTEIRPRSCLAPEGAVPSIVDYRPKSTLKVPATMRMKAKFPVCLLYTSPSPRD